MQDVMDLFDAIIWFIAAPCLFAFFFLAYFKVKFETSSYFVQQVSLHLVSWLLSK